jgi:hypothetical protein
MDSVSSPSNQRQLANEEAQNLNMDTDVKSNNQVIP